MIALTILNLVSTYFQIAMPQLTRCTAKRSTLKVAEAKQAAAYLLWRYTVLSGNSIAHLVGYSGRHNIIYSRKQIRKISTVDPVLRDRLKEIEQQLKRERPAAALRD